MAHFAEIQKNNNTVLRVIVVSNKDVNNNGGDLSTQAEIWVANNHPNDEIIKKELGGVYPETYWKQTSYNNNFRKKYAGIGYTFDSVKNIFIEPKPFLSWSLDINGNWQSPIGPGPAQDIEYFQGWDENNQRFFRFKKVSSTPRINYVWNVDLSTWEEINLDG